MTADARSTPLDPSQAAAASMTRWLPVPGYEDRYEVSDDGQVRILPGPGRHRRNQMQPLKPWRDTHGYWRADLSPGDGTRWHRFVHVLMLEAFVSARPPGMCGLHNDDDHDNNQLSNLRWGTRSENTLDIVHNGNHNNARKTHCKRGHPLEGENLKQTVQGRICVTCHRKSQREAARRRRALLRAAA
jgi:hypothetical protein